MSLGTEKPTVDGTGKIVRLKGQYGEYGAGREFDCIKYETSGTWRYAYFETPDGKQHKLYIRRDVELLDKPDPNAKPVDLPIAIAPEHAELIQAARRGILEANKTHRKAWDTLCEVYGLPKGRNFSIYEHQSEDGKEKTYYVE